MSLQPLGDRLVVEHLEQAEKTAGGVFLPDTAKEKPQKGKVIAVGPGRMEGTQRIKMDVQAGQTIVFSKYSGSEYKDAETGKEYLIISEKDVLAVVTDARVPAGV